jgi:octaheme c-type cytochrome (tetrathionate reductase family)
MRIKSIRGLLGLPLIVVGLLFLAVSGAFAQSGMDHSAFPNLQGPFESGPEVTAQCLTCHADVGEDVMGTIHWTWDYDNPVTGDEAGKYNVINNYCVSVRGNEPRCTSCHIGYGWRDDTFDLTNPGNIDCLVCHDSTGTYKKFPTGAGDPVYGETREFGGKEWPAPDLAAVAQGVAMPTRDNCGSCHFTGGGGDAVKHGDLDTSLKAPTRDLDVHMAADGANMTCQTCHTTEDHDISGGRYVSDYYDDGPARCETCHSDAPHDDAGLDGHTAAIACQTCHIPEYARAQPTKMTWDWTTAGELNPDGGGVWIITDPDTGKPTYDSRKGEFTWAANVVPEYRRFNGVYDWTLLSDTVTPDTGFMINPPQADADSKIYPFKLFTGTQPMDVASGTVAPLNLFPSGEADTTAFWKFWDIELAIQGGFEAYGLEYSGEQGSIDSEMYWLQTHMVAPADQALGCTDCHSAEGRLDFAALGYPEDRAAVLAMFPPVAPETTTTTAAPTTTTAAPETTTTEAATTTAAPETTTTVAAAPAEEESSSNIGLVVIIVIAAALVVGGGTYFFLRRRTS